MDTGGSGARPVGEGLRRLRPTRVERACFDERGCTVESRRRRHSDGVDESARSDVMKAAPAAVARRVLLPEAEMLVGDLARTEGGGRWATFAAPPLEESRDSHLA